MPVGFKWYIYVIYESIQMGFKQLPKVLGKKEGIFHHKANLKLDSHNLLWKEKGERVGEGNSLHPHSWRFWNFSASPWKLV